MRVWTTTWVRHFISTRFGIKYSRERVRQVVHALGVRLSVRRERAGATLRRPQNPGFFSCITVAFTRGETMVTHNTPTQAQISEVVELMEDTGKDLFLVVLHR